MYLCDGARLDCGLDFRPGLGRWSPFGDRSGRWRRKDWSGSQPGAQQEEKSESAGKQHRELNLGRLENEKSRNSVNQE
jgi:hypothetical protein